MKMAVCVCSVCIYTCTYVCSRAYRLSIHRFIWMC